MNDNVNREGLTYQEWFCAANAWGTVFRDTNVGRSHAETAWIAGEDPTEYAAQGNQKKRK